MAQGEPKDTQPGNETQQKERPQEAPREGEEPREPKDDPNGDTPESPDRSEELGRNEPGNLREREQGDPIPPVQDEDRWGDLPPRVEEIFRNQGRDDMPVQYRDWIDAYYRRLNRGG